MTGTTLLVTGSNGFTGRHLLRTAAARGYRCVALCHGDEDKSRQPAADVRAYADLTDPSSVDDVVDRLRPEYVIHLGAVSFVAATDLAAIYRTNVEGTVNLLQSLSRLPAVRRIVLASSAAVYGVPAAIPVSESAAIQPVSHYGASKYAMELAARCFTTLPEPLVVRPFNYTGVGQSEHFLVPKIVAAFRRGDRSITLGNLDVSRDFSDVRDVCEAYLDLLGIPDAEGPYNLCSGESWSLRGIISALEALTGHGMRVESDPTLMRGNDIPELRGNPLRLRVATGRAPAYRFRDTLAWMLAQGDS